MSEEETQQEATTEEAAAPEETPKNTDAELNGLFAFKVGMSSVYNEKGENVPVTVLRVEPHVISQVKTQEKDGYSAVQVAFAPKRAKRTTKAEAGRLKGAGFENGAYFTREFRQDAPEGAAVGQKVALSSLSKGDKVKITGQTKGRGFAGTMKRYGHGGGPASHGSGFHRRPGSIGNCAEPGFVMPGRKMPGHYGVETMSVRNVQVVEVIPEENVLMVKGPVPGSRNSLIQLQKM